MSMNLLEECRGAKRIGISGHIRPDGDCIGACMGLYLYLKKEIPQADVQVFLEKPADIYGCISGIGDVDSAYGEQEPFDVFFALDTSDDRLGEAQPYFEKAGKRINIDHHISNAGGCGEKNFVDPHASSTSELIYRLIGKEGTDREIAEALYMGMAHDTGCFQYSCTSPDTLRAAAELISYGFDFSRLIQETFYEKTYLQTQILGRALLESMLIMDKRCIVSVIRQRSMRFFQAQPSDLEGIVSQLRQTKGVEVAIFLHEIEPQKFKVSLRSKGMVDVSVIAKHFGGGGHVRAAGVMMSGSSHDVINNITARIALQLDHSGEPEDK